MVQVRRKFLGRKPADRPGGKDTGEQTPQSHSTLGESNEGRTGEPPKNGKKAEQPKSAAALITALSLGAAMAAVIGTIGLYFAAPGTIQSISIALGIIAALIIGAGLICEWQRRHVPAVGLLLAAAVFAGLTGATAHAGWRGKPSQSSPSGAQANTHYYLKVNVPQAATSGNPLPMVGCHAVVSGQAQFPPGCGIVIANRIDESGKEWYFVPNANWSGNQWSQTIYFGAPQDTGSRFALTVFAMPTSWRDYLAMMFNEAKPSGGGWVYQNLPPSPRYVTSMTVQRSDKGCSQQPPHK